MVIIRAGEIVAEGRPDEIAGQRTGQSTIGFDHPQGVQPDSVAAAAGRPVALEKGRITIQSDDVQGTLLRLTSWTEREHIDLAAIEVRRPSLEDVFLELTQPEEAVDG